MSTQIGGFLTLDAATKVGSLYCALPSAATLMKNLGFLPDTDWDLSLLEASTRRGIPLNDLMLALEQLDWGENSD